jgi:hypothetical protein
LGGFGEPTVGLGLPHYRGFAVILRHNTLGRTPLDELSASHRKLYLTTSMPPAVFEPAIPARELPQNHPLDHAATGLYGLI